MKKRLNIILIGVAVAVLVITVAEFKRLHASTKINRDALAVMREKNATVRLRIDALGQAISQQTKAKTPNRTTNKQLSRKEQRARTNARLLALEERKANDREFELRYFASRRTDLDLKYKPFYRVNHLSAEQSDALAEALFQRDLRYEKMQTTWQLDRSTDIKSMKKTVDSEFEVAAKEAVGSDLYNQFLLYERQHKAWDYVSNLCGNLSLMDVFFSVEQASQLANAIAEASTSYQNGRHVDLRTVDWIAADAVAEKFLTEEQLYFFKNLAPLSPDALFDLSRQNHELSNALKNLPEPGAVLESHAPELKSGLK